MKENKTFFKGLLAGILIVLAVNAIFNSGSVLYRRIRNEGVNPEKKINEILHVIDKYYTGTIDENKLAEGVYAGLVSGLEDPYSYYMDKSTFESFLEDTEGIYTGIGIVVKINPKDKKLIIISEFEDSPASKAGLMVGDKILKINDTEVGIDNYEESIKMMKGKEGTDVKLNIYRESTNSSFDVNVTRESIDVPTVVSKMIDEEIGYIKISKFDRVTYEQFTKAYETLEKSNMKKIIVDLRDNPGGLLDTVVKITDIFVPEGYITYIEDKNGKKEYEYSSKDCVKIPLIVLVNGNSASASEVFSGATKDFGVGKLVGTTTFGKGVVQNIYKLSDGSGIKVTIAKYYTPSGVCIDGKGIKPDYIVEASEDGTDLQLEKAIELIKDM